MIFFQNESILIWIVFNNYFLPFLENKIAFYYLILVKRKAILAYDAIQ